MIKNRKKGIAIAAALVVLATVAGTAAYFTAAEKITNTWTVGNVEIDLQEEEYEKYKDEETKNIVPNSELHKDPKVVNTGNNGAYVFMKVKVPKALVKVAGQDGSAPAEATLQELFDYQWNEGWAVIDTDEITEDGKTYQEYLLCYGTEDKCEAVEAGEETSTLLINGSADYLKNPGAEGMIAFKNIIEGQGLETVELKLDVESYAIQANNLTKENTDSPSEVWAIISNQTNI